MRALAAWVGAFAALVLLTVLVVSRIEVVTDLSFFLPEGRSVERQALAVGFDRPGTLMMVRLSGAPEADLAEISDRLSAALRGEPSVALVRNGRPKLDPAMRKYLLENRYLLGPDFAADHFSPSALREAIGEELDRLAGTAGWASREIFPRDPVGRFRDLFPQPRTPGGPDRRHGVWMDEQGRALMLVYLSAPAGDIGAQQAGKAVFDAALAAEAKDWPGLQAEVSGPGIFALRASERIRADMTRLTLIASGAVAAILLLMYRSVALLVLAGVPVGLGVLVGMLATQAAFGSVHGVAITFGVVLAGVAVDYPIHLFGHRRPGEAVSGAARRIARPMTIGAGTTFVGLAALTQSSFPGLAQIGVMSATGIATALVASRFLLPVLMTSRSHVVRAPVIRALWVRLRDSLRLRQAVVAGCGVMLVALTATGMSRPEPLWESDLSRIGVADAAARSLDGELRGALRLPDARRVLIVEGASSQDVLARWPDTLNRLDEAVRAGRLGGYPPFAGLLPTIDEQNARQAAMPSGEALRGAMTRAVSGLPIDPSVLGPFVADVERQKHAAPIMPQDMRAGPLGVLYPAPWQTDDGWAALIPMVPPIGLEDGDLADARLVDLAEIAQGIVGEYRKEAMSLLLIGLGLGAMVLAVGQRSLRRLWRVVAPPTGAIALTAAILLAAGVSLNLFHLLALLLIASIGVDYALFFPDYSATDQDGFDGFRSVKACCATSTVVFAVLATSPIPVLGAIGTTVAIGAVLSFLLTFCLAGGARSK